MLRAANSIADSKHADQPAAKSCSGLVPVPGLPGRDSLTSRRPSELRDMPARPPVVWAFAVYSTFSSRFITSSFMKSPDAWTPWVVGQHIGQQCSRHPPCFIRSIPTGVLQRMREDGDGTDIVRRLAR